MNRLGLTPKDNALRMQVGFRLSHENEYRLYVADKDGNWRCPMEALKELLALVRADEREACALLVEGGNFLHDEAPDAKWAEVICKWIRARGET